MNSPTTPTLNTTTADASPTPARKSSRNVWVVALFLLLAVAAGAAFWYTREHANSPQTHAVLARKSELPPAARAEGVRVDVVRPKPGGITRTSTQTGSVEAYEDADLYAKVSGYLKTLNVDIGDHVKVGDELAVIDDPELTKEQEHAAAKLAQSKAAVKQAEAKLESSHASERAAEAKVKQAKAEVARYSSSRRYREKELARYQDLYQRQAVQKAVIEEEEEHVEAAVGAEKAAEAAVETSKAQLAEAKANVLQAEADLAESRSEVDVAQSNLEKAKVFVSYMSIRSPYTGVVTARHVHPGAFIRSAAEGNQKPLLTVARTDKMRIVTYVPDRDVPYVDIGDPAAVDLDALDDTIHGKVTRFADSEVPESRTMRTEIDVPNPKDRIREGMFGQATITLEQTNAGLTIPTGCLAGESKAGKAHVFVVREGKAKEVPITIGIDDGIRVEVLSGLTPDDQVIASRSTVTEGVPVTVSESPAAPTKATPG